MEVVSVWSLTIYVSPFVTHVPFSSSKDENKSFMEYYR